MSEPDKNNVEDEEKEVQGDGEFYDSSLSAGLHDFFETFEIGEPIKAMSLGDLIG